MLRRHEYHDHASPPVQPPPRRHVMPSAAKTSAAVVPTGELGDEGDTNSDEEPLTLYANDETVLKPQNNDEISDSQSKMPNNDDILHSKSKPLNIHGNENGMDDELGMEEMDVGKSGGNKYCDLLERYLGSPEEHRMEEDADYKYSRRSNGGQNGGGEVEDDEEDEDIYSLLESKERDLILAAELGKALLEKNEELSKQNERLAEEYSLKLEELEQEKYQLKRQLETAEEEYQLRLSELQGDVVTLRQTLERQENALRIQERERSQIISELMEQNHKLTQELRDARRAEKELRDQINKMRVQFSIKRTSMQDHFHQVENLREEIDDVLNKKSDLERQIKNLLSERESLTSSLDLSMGKITSLERKYREQEHLIRHGEKEINELRSTNHHLQERLESVSRSRSSSPGCRMSLQSELEMSGSESEKSLKRVCDVIDEEDPEDFEMDLEDNEFSTQVRNEIKELTEEIRSAYTQLHNMCMLLRERQKRKRKSSGDSLETFSTNSSSSVSIYEVKIGQLMGIVAEIRALIQHFLREDGSDENMCSSCGKGKEEKQQLEISLHQTKERMERGQLDLKKAELEAKKREDELMGLKNKLTLMEARLAAAEEERKVLKSDLMNLSTSRDETIKRAWETRDSAVSRKNAAEVELARSRIDLMQVNSQLLEAVQQKVNISQQLEDWETDLHKVIEQRITDDSQSESGHPSTAKREVNNNNNNSSNSNRNVARKNSSTLMSFFQRS